MIRTASEQAPEPEELLRHAAWARRLARSLAADDSGADDLVQDSWESALRRPPDTTTPLRPWLRTVLRHQGINRAREGRRREAREAAAAPPREVASPEVLVSRLQAHRLLVDAVLALKEPYRQTVLLHYFQGLSSVQIAVRIDVPPATVRGRLKTALGLLREALGARADAGVDWMEALGDLLKGDGRSTGPGPGDGPPEEMPPRPRAIRPSSPIGIGLAAKFILATALSGVTLMAARRIADRRPNEQAATASPSDETNADARLPPRLDVIPAPARAPVAVGESSPIVRSPGVRRQVVRSAAVPSAVPVARWPSGYPSAAQFRPCTIAGLRPTPIAEACQQGGLPAAKKAMKRLLTDIRAKGRKLTCEGCHVDLDNYALVEGAQEKLADALKLLASSGGSEPDGP